MRRLRARPAAELASRVQAAAGVIDAGVWGYSVTQLFGVRDSPVAIKGQMLPVRAHGVALMSLIELRPGVQLLLITTPQHAVATVARRGAAMAKDSRVPVVGVIENMASTTCQSCSASTPVFGEGAGARLAEDLILRGSVVSGA